MAENEYDGVDIPEDLLEGIAGGEMTDVEKANINAFIIFGKKAGMTLEQILDKFSFLGSNENADEYYDYITQYYNSL